MTGSSDQVRAGAPPPMPQAFFGFATALMGIAFYLIIEVNVTMQRFFKKRGGLYYWCILIASWGTCLHTIAFIIQWWVPGSSWILCAALGQFGWTFMITAQSLVLYSRLHLVIRSHAILRGALIMIITTSIAVEVPNWVTSWFAYDTDPRVTGLWTPRDNIMLRISQLVIFLQESSLSILYIWGTIKVLTPNDKINVRRIKWDLIAVNSFIIATDLVNVILTYTSEHYAKEPIQNFSYAFKLRIEFVVLNQLMAVTSQSRACNYNAGGRYVKETGWHSDSSTGGGAVSKAPNPLRKISSSDDSMNGPPLQRAGNAPSDLVAMTYGAATKTRSFSNNASVPIPPGGLDMRHGPEAVPRAKVKMLREGSSDNVAIQQQNDRSHASHLTSNHRESSEETLPVQLQRCVAVAADSGDGWWGRLLHRIDPPYEERWQRDLSRV